MRNLTLLSLCLALFLLRASCANGKVVVFGDSLSDNGNLYAITGAAKPLNPYPPPPYGVAFDGTNGFYPGRFTDGQNWVDYFPAVAKSFGVDIPPSTAHFQTLSDDNSTNFAVGGSTSGNVNVLSQDLPGFDLPGFPAQISAYLTSLSGESAGGDICVIWIGANDFSAGISPKSTVDNILNGLTRLSKAGAKKIVVVDIPDLSLTPVVRELKPSPVQDARAFVYSVNVALAIELPLFALMNRVEVDLVDINGIFIPLVFSPSIFGFTNSVGAAFNPNTGALVPDPNDYVFWDGFHPTTKAHQIAAQFIYTSVFSRRHFREFSSLQ
jgi:outer membrane lipase/esterase